MWTRPWPSANHHARRFCSASASVHGIVDRGIGRILIDNPSKRNAMSLKMYEDVPSAVKDATCGVRVTVLSGAGDTSFGAGSDIKEFKHVRTGAAAAQRYSEIENAATSALRSITHPLIASIQGPCYGGALNLALAADLRFCADDATFCVPPAKLGIGYPRSLMELLVQAVGKSNSKDLLFTARVVGAQEALRVTLTLTLILRYLTNPILDPTCQMGLVNAVLPKAELSAHVDKVAATISKLAPMTIAAAKMEDPHLGPGSGLNLHS